MVASPMRTFLWAGVYWLMRVLRAAPRRESRLQANVFGLDYASAEAASRSWWRNAVIGKYARSAMIFPPEMS